MMKASSAIGKAGILLLVSSMLLVMGVAASAQESGGMDHSAFGPLEGPFETGPDVTAACLTCHSGVGDDFMETVHWTWEYESETTGETYGKYQVLNNYCVNVRTNEPRCTSCHAGYGWTDESFDHSNPGNIDCLVCHDSTGTYKKFPTGAGHPAYEDKVFGGKDWPAVDLVSVAQGVALPTRSNCGACHFTGGGGDAVKHGDMDTSLKSPDFELDVHMDAEGLNFTCQTCHTTEDHQVAGSRYEMGAIGCDDCHTDAPHDEDAINAHTASIACETCHIPEYARAQPTKEFWDWTTAGERNDDGSIKIVADEATGKPIYDSRKGSFLWESNVVPTYLWSNGTFDWSLPGEPVIQEDGFLINEVLGGPGDGKIAPFKEFDGIQPYDAANQAVMPLNLFPSGEADTTAFWKFWDMSAAITDAATAYGLEYSGSYENIESVMYWPQNHMVAPAADALECQACHSEGGRLDFASLGFDGARVAELTAFPPGPEPEPETTTTTAAPTTTTSDAPTTTTLVAAADDVADESSSTGLVVGIIAAVVVLGGLGFMMMRRRTA
jgi:octaheme c-type cytochrome (tetrathionate reductase family)